MMIENESDSKRVRVDSQPSPPDFLSDLPLSIIHIILALIPFRDAVRTSILSREWRYTWATLPRLVIDQECANPEAKSKDELEDYMEYIITHVLFCHKGPIHKFKMSFRFETNCPDIDEWILRLSRNDIKELTLDMGYPCIQESLQVHSSIYTCEKLTTLQLNNCELDPPPSAFKGFLFLRCLILHDIDVSSDTIEILVANSPLLEKLELVELVDFESSELRISAPNLKYMKLIGDYINTEICIYAPLLAEMYVLFVHDYFTSIVRNQKGQKRSVCHYTNFLGGLTNLEKLTTDHFFVKYLSVGIESCSRTLVFHHLKEIELNDVNFEDIKEISLVARLIIGSPNLHKLKISTNLVNREDDTYASDSESPDVCYSDFGCGPDFTFAKLRVVVMKDISGYPSEAEFMVFLLQNSPALESMMVDHSCARDDWEKELLVDRLVGCDWASPNAELLIPTRRTPFSLGRGTTILTP